MPSGCCKNWSGTSSSPWDGLGDLARRISTSDRVRRSSQSEGGRRKAEAKPIVAIAAYDGLRKGSSHPTSYPRLRLA
jgi:hypothetical protein